MATVISGSSVKLNNGQTVQAQQGAWYDGQQFWGGSLSNPGQINTQSNQQGAGQQVSNEVVAQTNPANVQYLQQQQQQPQAPVAPPMMPTGGLSSISTSPGSIGTTGVGISPAATLNLPQLYESLYASSGIRDIESQLLSKTNDYKAAVSKIKDNPYLSEGTMTGRIKKLDEKFGADSQNIKNDIAMRKADIETQLNLQTKQFDINSESAKQALDQFNTLLSAGALDNISGEDIANLTRATGLSSSMIQSAIDANKKKNEPALNIEKVDDGTNVYAVAIDSKGNIVNRQLLGASAPTAAEIKAGQPAKATAAETKASESQQNTANLVTDIKGRHTLRELITYYSKVLSIDEIYRLYNTYSPYGAAKETLAQVKQGKYKA